jgi:dTDP-glucose 4,6-dehydratase
LAQLAAAGCREIKNIDLVPSGFGGPVTDLPMDIRTGDVASALKGSDIVLNLAACSYLSAAKGSQYGKSTYGLPYDEVNVAGTERLREAAQQVGVRKFVFTSSTMVYGFPQAIPIPDDHPRTPMGPYGESKRLAEDLITTWAKKGVDCAIVRPSLVIGDGRLGIIARIFEWIRSGRTIWLLGNGKNKYQMVSAKDCARLVLLASLTEGFGVYNCGCNDVPTMREWIEAIIAHVSSKSRVVPLPGAPIKLGLRVLERLRLSPLRAEQYELADVNFVLDTSEARQRLGWSETETPMEFLLSSYATYTARAQGQQ